MSFPYYFFQYITTSLELFIVNTILLRDTKVKDGDVLDQNGYNICYAIYQFGLFAAIILSSVFMIRMLPLFPGVQMLFLLLLIYLDFQCNSESELIDSFPSAASSVRYYQPLCRINRGDGLCILVYALV